MINVIIFDLGGVYFTDGTSIAIEKASKLLTRKKATYIFKGRDALLYRRGTINRKEFWKRIGKYLNTDEKTCDKLEEIWHSSYELNKGMKQLVRRLRKKYKVIVFSGITKEKTEYLDKKYKFKREFDMPFFSFKYGFEKTDAKNCVVMLKKIMLKKLKIKPEKYVLIDDKEKFIEQSKRSGINAILFRNITQLKRDLIKLGVEV
jgi:FMN phosphatase YigB (HAD superfamily)